MDPSEPVDKNSEGPQNQWLFFLHSIWLWAPWTIGTPVHPLDSPLCFHGLRSILFTKHSPHFPNGTLISFLMQSTETQIHTIRDKRKQFCILAPIKHPQSRETNRVGIYSFVTAFAYKRSLSLWQRKSHGNARANDVSNPKLRKRKRDSLRIVRVRSNAFRVVVNCEFRTFLSHVILV